MKLYIVRHGETSWNAQGKLHGGDKDIVLNQTGKEQARKIAKRLKKEDFHSAYSSPMKRTKETAELIVKEHKELEIKEEESLRERRYGKLEGMPYKDFKSNFEKIKKEKKEEEYEIENKEKFVQRIEEFLEKIKKEHKEEKILIVSHSSTIKVLLSLILGINIEKIYKGLRKKNASLTVVEFDEKGQGKILILADDSHLIDELIEST